MNETKKNNLIKEEVIINCWLEEYRTLMREIDIYFGYMRYMVILNISALGTFSGIVLSDFEKYKLMLLIIPILSSMIGFLVYASSKRISQFGHYVWDKIAPRLAALTCDSQVLGLEEYLREEERKKNAILRPFSLSGFSLITFLIPSILAVIFAAKPAFHTGCGWTVFWCIGLLLTILLIIAHVDERRHWFGTKKEHKS
jgi:peptidoglycan/LPS O-acetylase OafA/YrhL